MNLLIKNKDIIVRCAMNIHNFKVDPFCSRTLPSKKVRYKVFKYFSINLLYSFLETCKVIPVAKGELWIPLPSLVSIYLGFRSWQPAISERCIIHGKILKTKSFQVMKMMVQIFLNIFVLWSDFAILWSLKSFLIRFFFFFFEIIESLFHS